MEAPPPIPSAPPAAPLEPAMPLYARFLNIFAVPSAVFETVKHSRVSVANWLLPLLLTTVTAVASSMIVAAQPGMQQLMKERQQKQESALAQKVQEGKLAAEDAKMYSKAVAFISRPRVFQFIAGGFGLLGGCVKIFGWAMALWFLAIVFLKTRLRYLKALEIAGLAGLIGLLGTIVPLLLQVNFSHPAVSPGLVTTASNFDAKSPLNLVLAALNLCELWQLAVLALGLARLTDVPFPRAGFAVFGFWLIWMSGLLGFATIFGGLGG